MQLKPGLRHNILSFAFYSVFMHYINMFKNSFRGACANVLYNTCVLHLSRPTTGLAPGRKRAYMLYRAALTEATRAEGKQEGVDTPSVVVPHPYTLALGVLSIQKVCTVCTYTYVTKMQYLYCLFRSICWKTVQ